jgi:hypothetical protein
MLVPTGTQFSQEIVVAVSGGNDYVAWEDHMGNGSIQAYEATSQNNGVQWLPSVDLNPNDPKSVEPIIAISANGDVNIVMRASHHGVIYNALIEVSSADQGNTFSAPLVLASEIRHASIVADGSSIDILYLHKTTDWEVNLIRSTDDGAHWLAAVDVSGPTGVTTSPSTDIWLPSISAVNGQVTIAWVGSTDCFAVTSSDGGATFSSAITLGAGNSVLSASQFVLWLNANDHPQLTTLA